MTEAIWRRDKQAGQRLAAGALSLIVFLSTGGFCWKSSVDGCIPSLGYGVYGTVRATKVANLGYWFLFPGFFFYYFAMGLGILPEIDGYFGGVVIVILAYYVTLGFPNIVERVNLAPSIGGLFILLFAWCLIWTASQKVMSWPVPDGAVLQIVIMLLGWAALFSVGVFIGPDDGWFRKYLMVAFATILIIVLAFTDWQFLIFNPRRAFEVSDIPSYQGFARSGMMVCMALLAGTASTWRRWLLTALSAILLFLLGARSEFFGFVGAIIVLEARALLRLRYMILVAVGVSAAVIAFLSGALGDSRQLQVFDLSHSSSWIARQEMTVFAWEQIKDNPVMGVFGGHFLLDPAGGGYAHNALSAWVSFGALGFFLYMSLSLTSCWIACKPPGRYEFVTTRWRLAVYLNVSSLLLIFMAKPIFWAAPALAWGSSAALLLERSRKRRASAVEMSEGPVEPNVAPTVV